MTRRAYVLGIVVSGLVTATAAQPGDTLATVGGRTISARDFSRVLMSMRGSDYATTLKTLTPDGRRTVLDDLVATRAFAQAARDQGLDRRDDVVFDVEQAVAVVLERHVKQELQRKLAPSDGEVRQWYGAHRDQLASAPRAKARHILVATEDDARAVATALGAGATFEDVARTRSLDTQTREHGGELGWVPRGFMVAAFDTVLFSLRPGQVSDPVKTSFGYHLIKVDEFDQSTIPAFEAAEGRVRELVVDERMAAARADLMRKYNARIDHDALDRFGRPTERP